MVNIKSKLNVCDNSGALIVECIKVLGKKKNIAKLGDKLIVTIKRYKYGYKINKGDLKYCILVRYKKPTLRSNGVFLSFGENSVVIINDKNNPIANRIKGCVSYELRKLKLFKVILLSSYII